MNTYLYTWNPENWSWYDLQSEIYHVNNNEMFDSYWSCGNTKRIEIGDTFFLMRLGVEPKGIVGFGYILSKPYPLPHWDKEKAKEGKIAYRTDIVFKALAEDPIIPLTHLSDEYPSVHWTPQSSGVSIPGEIADELIGLLQSRMDMHLETPSIKELIKFSEGKPKYITSKTYDRSSAARRACIGYHGYLCSICGFNFGKVYGDIGVNYIEVHHLHPISEFDVEHEINPVEDLRPVCANCHRMLHKTKPQLSIEELKIIKDDVYGMVRRKPKDLK